MATYKDSGVDIAAGDIASKNAYAAAKATFSARDGMIGKPVILEGGFAGALDFGDYYMILNCDGVGTKIDIALETQNFSGMGYDLLAMTADDAVCVGAEVVSITNTFDTNKVDSKEISEMMESLKNACIQEKVTISGGEIAELGNTLSKTIWNSTALGIVEKEKFITGDKIQKGDRVIALKEEGFRSNGFSLVRYILKENGIKFSDQFNNEKTWGELLLTPSKIYHNAVLECIGRFGQERKVDIHGIIHVTGGGIQGNASRILKNKNLEIEFDNLFPLPEVMKRVAEIGNVSKEEIEKTWNQGNGMLLILPGSETEKTLTILQENGVEGKVVGQIS